MSYIISENENKKVLASKEVNYIFDKNTGFSAVWGRTKSEDPLFSPYGPFIADIEITTKCNGPGGKLCPFCYKANTPNGHNMSYDEFVQIFNKLPDTLQQIAFGVDAQCTSNPDVWKIMKHCETLGVIPNVTVADIDYQTALNLSEICGAVAVSRYEDKNLCYDSVKRLVDNEMEQVNIHIMLSKETLPMVIETIEDKINGEERLKGLNAIVFLSLKKRGRGVNHTSLDTNDFKYIVDLCLENDIVFGFDSCSCMKFLDAVKGHPKEEFFKMISEPCESSRFSIYIDAYGDYYPCSFMEGQGEWEEGISVLNCNDFMEDVWNSERNKHFRDMSIHCLEKNVACQYYDV
jgi:radical SAM protein with 4Fe4S-binding SPASM domain